MLNLKRWCRDHSGLTVPALFSWMALFHMAPGMDTRLFNLLWKHNYLMCSMVMMIICIITDYRSHLSCIYDCLSNSYGCRVCLFPSSCICCSYHCMDLISYISYEQINIYLLLLTIYVSLDSKSLHCPEALSKSNNKYVYRQPRVNQYWQWSQVDWMLTHHRDELSSASFNLILDNSVDLWVGLRSASDLVSTNSKFRILHTSVEDNLSSFDSK